MKPARHTHHATVLYRQLWGGLEALFYQRIPHRLQIMASLSILQKQTGRPGLRGNGLPEYFVRSTGCCQIAGMERVLQGGKVLGALTGRKRDFGLRRMGRAGDGGEVH
jgi:hypothetical protein